VKQDLPIGVFDSGVGGLTVVRQLQRILPCETLIYLGDTARVPYGTKNEETIIRFSCEDANFLVEKKVKAIVVACNTATSVALPTLQKKFDIPIFGVVIPGAEAGVTKTQTNRIGVIATAATIRSKAYTLAIKEKLSTAKIFPLECPLLVPLVEEGWLANKITLAVLKKYLSKLVKKDIDTLILGCTHYPLLANSIKNVLRELTSQKINIVDSAETCARYVKEKLSSLDLLCTEQNTEQPKLKLFVTDTPKNFNKISKLFLKRSDLLARQIQLKPLL